MIAQTPTRPARCSRCSSGSAAVQFVLPYIRRFSGGRYALDVQNDLRTALFERLQRLDFARHDELPTGQLVSRASSDLQLVQMLLQFLPMLTGNVVMLVLSLFVMLLLSPLLTLRHASRPCPRCWSSRCGCARRCTRRSGTRCSAPARSPASSTKPSPASAS